ncbi:MAG: outer membrane beta-barrel protein [Deltaproteobacteria bacterium]|nr:outer membrane beta-barrel protein [Deltaproteobacteria bacterium]
MGIGSNLSLISAWASMSTFSNLIQTNSQSRLALLVSVAGQMYATYTDPGGHFFPQGQKDTDTSVGLTAGAGLTFMVTPSIDLFTEYRFTHFSPEFRVTTDNLVPGLVVPAKVNLDANTHRVLFGISYHFNLFGG